MSPDPRDGGFVSGVAGLAGGGYERRIAEREATHQGELDAGQRLRAEAQAVEAERAALRGDLTRAQGRLVEQNRRIAAERARLSAGGSTAELRRLDQAQARLDGARTGLQKAGSDELPVSEAKRLSRDVQAELDAIDALVASIGEGAL